MNDYLKQVEDQLVELTERGAHRRPRPRLDVLALGSAVVVVAVVAIVVSTIGGSAHHGAAAALHRSTTSTPAHHPAHHTKTVAGTTSSTPSGPPPAGAQVPSGFGPESFTAISELNWWLLGTTSCSSPPCTSIARTADGGRTFVSIPAPRAPGFGHVSQLRFANAQDGFAFGPELWVTHDGGAHWQQWSIGTVNDVATSGAYAYAIATNDGTGRLYRSSVGGNSWQLLPAAGDATGGLWVQRDEVLVESSTQSGQQLRVSRDDGSTFTSYPAPPSVACQFEESEPPIVWAHCATGMMSGTWRSANGGASFAAIGGKGLPELPNSAAFGSASATTAVVGYQQLYRTTDGGATWTPATGPAGISAWQYIGFTDPTHGVAIGFVGSEQSSNERLYYTTDGGASYHLVSIG